jgi:hypothetical protein
MNACPICSAISSPDWWPRTSGRGPSAATISSWESSAIRSAARTPSAACRAGRHLRHFAPNADTTSRDDGHAAAQLDIHPSASPCASSPSPRPSLSAILWVLRCPLVAHHGRESITRPSLIPLEPRASAASHTRGDEVAFTPASRSRFSDRGCPSGTSSSSLMTGSGGGTPL